MILALILAAQWSPVQLDISNSQAVMLPSGLTVDQGIMLPLFAGMNGAGDADMVYVSDRLPISDPTFERSPKGWLPHCPAGTDLVRHRPAPDCFWGTAPMSQKPTQGDFECVGIGMVQNLPACPAE